MTTVGYRLIGSADRSPWRSALSPCATGDGACPAVGLATPGQRRDERMPSDQARQGQPGGEDVIAVAVAFVASQPGGTERVLNTILRTTSATAHPVASASCQSGGRALSLR